MKDGKKTVAQRIVYKALRKLTRSVKKAQALLESKERHLQVRGAWSKGLPTHPALLLERVTKRLQPCWIARTHRFRGGRGRKGYLYRMSVYKKSCFSLTWIVSAARTRTRSRRNLSEDLSK